jgi:dihydroorotase
MEAMSPYVWAFSDDGHGVEDHELMFRACKAAAELGRVIFPHPEFAHVSDRGLSEELELLRDLWLCRRTGCRLHIAHLSTPGAVELCALAKAKGLPVTCEVTPHHLGLCREEVGYTVNPPLGDRATREALRQALKEGVIDAIATDHAPHTREDKDHGAPGISGIETAFPLLYTSLVREGLLSLAELSQYLSLGPARVLGLPKGAIQVGKDGDLVLVEEDEPLYVTDGFFLSRGHNSPLLGMKLWGKVWATVHRGEVVHVDGKVRGRDFDDYRQVI